jgi:hypothetical protein
MNPVKLTIELPAVVHRDLLAYAEILARESRQSTHDPAKLIAPMLARFMATDRALQDLEGRLTGPPDRRDSVRQVT